MFDLSRDLPSSASQNGGERGVVVNGSKKRKRNGNGGGSGGESGLLAREAQSPILNLGWASPGP